MMMMMMMTLIHIRRLKRPAEPASTAQLLLFQRPSPNLKLKKNPHKISKICSTTLCVLANRWRVPISLRIKEKSDGGAAFEKKFWRHKHPDTSHGSHLYCKLRRLHAAVELTRGQSNLTKSASRGAHYPVRGHPKGSKVVPLNSWGRVFY